jgi:hypothetical protein
VCQGIGLPPVPLRWLSSFSVGSGDGCADIHGVGQEVGPPPLLRMVFVGNWSRRSDSELARIPSSSHELFAPKEAFDLQYRHRAQRSTNAVCSGSGGSGEIAATVGVSRRHAQTSYRHSRESGKVHNGPDFGFVGPLLRQSHVMGEDCATCQSASSWRGPASGMPPPCDARPRRCWDRIGSRGMHAVGSGPRR